MKNETMNKKMSLLNAVKKMRYAQNVYYDYLKKSKDPKKKFDTEKLKKKLHNVYKYQAIVDLIIEENQQLVPLEDFIEVAEEWMWRNVDVRMEYYDEQIYDLIADGHIYADVDGFAEYMRKYATKLNDDKRRT